MHFIAASEEILKGRARPVAQIFAEVQAEMKHWPLLSVYLDIARKTLVSHGIDTDVIKIADDDKAATTLAVALIDYENKSVPFFAFASEPEHCCLHEPREIVDFFCAEISRKFDTDIFQLTTGKYDAENFVLYGYTHNWSIPPIDMISSLVTFN